jgi:hypothetical protein
MKDTAAAGEGCESFATRYGLRRTHPLNTPCRGALRPPDTFGLGSFPHGGHGPCRMESAGRVRVRGQVEETGMGRGQDADIGGRGSMPRFVPFHMPQIHCSHPSPSRNLHRNCARKTVRHAQNHFTTATLTARHRLVPASREAHSTQHASGTGHGQEPFTAALTVCLPASLDHHQMSHLR